MCQRRVDDSYRSAATLLRMNPTLDRILTTKAVCDVSGTTYPLQVHIPREEGEFLQDVVRQIRPRTSVEIGLAFGVSTLYICEAMKESGGTKHIVCDPDQFEGFHGIGIKHIDEAGYAGMVEFHPVSSHILLPQLERDSVRVQFAFIDGWHTFDYTLMEFFFIDRILDVGGVIAFDDTFSYPAIRKVLRYILTHRKYTIFGAETWPPSLTLRVAELVAKMPGVRHIAKPEVVLPHFRLRINGHFVAVQKQAEDVLGSGENGTRRWDQHFDF